MSTATVEASALAAAAYVIYVRQETVTSMWRRLRKHPVGLLALGAVTGAAVAHLWIENT